MTLWSPNLTKEQNFELSDHGISLLVGSLLQGSVERCIWMKSFLPRQRPSFFCRLTFTNMPVHFMELSYSFYSWKLAGATLLCLFPFTLSSTLICVIRLHLRPLSLFYFLIHNSFHIAYCFILLFTTSLYPMPFNVPGSALFTYLFYLCPASYSLYRVPF